MLLGNKCDMEDVRVVSKAKGEQVNSCLFLHEFTVHQEQLRDVKRMQA